MIRKIVQILTVFVGIAFVADGGAKCQTQPESSSTALVLQSKVGKRDAVFPLGSTIAVKYTIDARTFRGMHIDEVLDSAIILNGDTVELKYLENVTARRDQLHKAGAKVLIASVISIVAAALLALGMSAAFLTGSALLILWTVLFVFASIAASLAMPSGLVVGIVLMAISTKTYHLFRDWTATTRIKSK